MQQQYQIPDALVWVDLEMTGLNTKTDVVLEIALLVSDSSLLTLIPGPCLVISQPKVALDAMDDWCTRTHTESGLVDKVLASTTSELEAEEQVLAFLEKWVEKGKGVLAGNSVHVDRQFMLASMPRVMEYLHYRIVDVSTVKELAKRWYPLEFENAPKKKLCHRALDDILESIEELKYYQKNVFKLRPRND